jgi:peptidoglycan LD-endopeptidase LytH
MSDIISRRMPKTEARKLMHDALAFLREDNAPPTASSGDRSTWRYPFDGYSPARLGRRTRRDYLGANAYDFFDGNSHRGHPAYDLFIRDRNQDNLDDGTGKPVHVRSVTGGVVICAQAGWTADSVDAVRKDIIRGGKYVFIYDPGSNGIFYYAHLRTIVIYPGQRLAAGDIIGDVGRTGKNAMMKRSGTHLHIMCLDASSDDLRPKPIFDDLVKMKWVL